MADITYCINSVCPFTECERHPKKINKACRNGKGYVSVTSYDGTCREYISYLVDKAGRRQT